jgi:hypothetical protein
MKSIQRFLTSTLLASAALLVAAPRLSAQSAPSVAPQPIRPPPVERTASNPFPNDPTTLNVKIEGGKMAGVIDVLQKTLDAAHKPQLNVLFGPGVQEISVPALTLQNVSGTDALRLIAVSAGCTVEAIKGERTDVIGYQILASNPPAAGKAAAEISGMSSSTKTAPRASNSQGYGDLTLAPSPTRDVRPTPARTAKESIAAQPIPGTSNSVIGFTAPAQSGPLVRVHALGEITNQVKFSDVAQTLEELLKAAGVSLDTAKLKVHEKTNVLVVTGDAHVQDLVSQLLEALQQNAAIATAQNSREQDGRRQAVELETRLNAERDQAQRLMKRLDEAESQLTTVQRELDRAKAAAPPKAQ